MSLAYMLGTSISSAAIRGEEAVSARLNTLAQDEWCISVITMAEHTYGIARRPW